MITEFRLNAKELDEEFLKKLKALFSGSENLYITVEEDLDETEYLLKSDANRDMLEKSMESNEGYEISDEDLQTLESKGKIDFSNLKKIKLE